MIDDCTLHNIETSSQRQTWCYSVLSPIRRTGDDDSIPLHGANPLSGTIQKMAVKEHNDEDDDDDDNAKELLL
jgi:hypothetical protein